VALADVWAAVDASTAANTKKAYRSDSAQVYHLDDRAGLLPRCRHRGWWRRTTLTEAAAEQTGVGRWRYTPATLSRWVSSINQFHSTAGLE